MIPALSPDTPAILRPVEGFPGYFVGDDGTVRSAKARPGVPRPLRPRAHPRTGHLRVRLYGGVARSRSHNGRRARFADLYVHVLVCTAWHGPPPFAGAMVCHGDGDPANNVPRNLRWDDAFGNAADLREHRADRAVEAAEREGKRLGDGPGAIIDLRWGF